MDRIRVVAGNLRMGKEEIDDDGDAVPDGISQIDGTTPEGREKLKLAKRKNGKFVLRPRKEKAMFQFVQWNF